MRLLNSPGRPLYGLACLALVCALGLAPAVDAKPAASVKTDPTAVRLVTADSSGYGGQLALSVGGSRILRVNQSIGRVLVGDPKVADVIPLSDKTVYVLGKAAGSSSLTIMPTDNDARPIAAMDLRVGFDIDALKRGLADVMPGEEIAISAQGDGLVLSGTVSSSAVAARAAALADHYAPEKVVNLLGVRGPEQVMLSVHVAEVQRSALRQLGITSLQGSWNDLGQIISLPALTANPDSLVNILGLSKIGAVTVDGLFEALERKGYASTLAEPTLTALSGETAQFFAGGEFPIPVPQIQAGQTIIVVEYKQYGVSVGFTPTVYGDSINLVVAPEVSALDRENSVQLQGFKIPGLTTRRAKTTVELRNGQSFAIAGLIRRDFSDSMRGLPGAASLPIFGALFRSTAYQNNETEVVIIVTAHLAKPTERRNLILPTDARRAPNAGELFLLGATDRPKTPTAPTPAEGPHP
ncbi:MAG: pilus assembly protein CpaC [Phenylobacterium sp.]|nr:pilus assembly protein CpaC [Phenylobacterium sp.]